MKYDVTFSSQFKEDLKLAPKAEQDIDKHFLAIKEGYNLV